MNAPVVLDFDHSVGALPGATTFDLSDWHEAIRFGCSTRTLRSVQNLLQQHLPAAHGCVFTGSGDFHHLSWPLIERAATRAPLRVVVLDNHPDNMRFPFGIHCGSWVRRVALLPGVSRVDVLGITSTDISAAHAWENYLTPLRRGKLAYWSVGVDTRWAARLGIGHAFHNFATMADLIDRFGKHFRRNPQPTYLSIDKDVLSPAVARSNWDQGCMSEAELMALIDLLAGHIVGSDITGEVSVHRYRSWWKRRLSALDGQPVIDPAQLRDWQAQQHALNLRLLDRLNVAR